MRKFISKIATILIIGAISSVFQACGGGDNKNGSNNDDRSLAEMLDENDFAAANQHLSKVYNNGADKNDYNGYRKRVDKYIPDATKILKVEASYLMDQDDPEAEQLFQLCINDVASNIGNQQVITGHFDGKEQTETKFYIEEVTPYNACLLSIIKEAVIKEKPDFAKKVFKMMKKNYVIEQNLKPGMDSGKVSSYTYDCNEDNAILDEAQRIIAEYEAEH